MVGKCTMTLLAVCCLYFEVARGARMARDAPAPPDAKDGTNEVQKSLQENTDTLAAKLDDLSNKFKEQVSSATGSVQKVFEDASTKLRDAVEKLKSSAPDAGDVQESTKQLGERLKGGLDSAVQETRRVSDALAKNAQGVDSTLSDTFKAYYEELLKTSESVRGQVDQAVKGAVN